MYIIVTQMNDKRALVKLDDISGIVEKIDCCKIRTKCGTYHVKENFELILDLMSDARTGM